MKLKSSRRNHSLVHHKTFRLIHICYVMLRKYIKAESQEHNNNNNNSNTYSVLGDMYFWVTVKVSQVQLLFFIQRMRNKRYIILEQRNVSQWQFT